MIHWHKLCLLECNGKLLYTMQYASVVVSHYHQQNFLFDVLNLLPTILLKIN